MEVRAIGKSKAMTETQDHRSTGIHKLLLGSICLPLTESQPLKDWRQVTESGGVNKSLAKRE